MRPKVFLSYSSLDETIAGRVCSALEAADIPCWIAPRNILPGVDYPRAIVEAITSVQVLVLILTPQAAASPHILSEVGQAFNNKKRIIPFRFSNDPLPEDLEYFLSMTQWLDATDGCTDENIKRLIEAILDPLAGRGDRRAIKVHRRRTMMVGAFVLLALLTGAMLYKRWEKSRATLPNAAAERSAVRDTKPQPKMWLNPIDEDKYVWIPPGSFTMGCSPGDNECSDNEKPAHTVDIEKGFWLGQTEVTIGAYRRFAAKHALKLPAGDATLPITGLMWAKAKEYCAAIGGRLPTEAEWEFAARAGNSQAYYGMPSNTSWFAENSGDARHPVGEKLPNAFGVYDMLGNVREWVLDRYYGKYYLDSPATGPNVEQPLASNATAVVRGAFWGSDAQSVRVSHRSEQETDAEDDTIGFRCAVDRP
jgi:formylglycine-generating enzyme required for sulfatase activity